MWGCKDYLDLWKTSRNNQVKVQVSKVKMIHTISMERKSAVRKTTFRISKSHHKQEGNLIK